jgi:hypothetical protein
MQRIDRRQLLLGAGAGGAALAGLAMPAGAAAASNQDNGGGSLEGAWIVTHVDPSGSAKAVATFASGGAFATRDINPAGSPGFGGFAKREDHRFVVTFWNGTFGPGGSTVVIKVILHGRWNDDHISGTTDFQSFDASGHPGPSGSGTFQGTRIKPGE